MPSPHVRSPRLRLQFMRPSQVIRLLCAIMAGKSRCFPPIVGKFYAHSDRVTLKETTRTASLVSHFLPHTTGACQVIRCDFFLRVRWEQIRAVVGPPQRASAAADSNGNKLYYIFTMKSGNCWRLLAPNLRVHISAK